MGLLGLIIICLGALLFVIAGIGRLREPRRSIHWIWMAAGLLVVGVGMLLRFGGLHALKMAFYAVLVIVAPLCMLCMAWMLLSNARRLKRRKKDGALYFQMAGALLGLTVVSVAVVLFCRIGTILAGLLYGFVFLMCFFAVVFIVFLLAFRYYSTLPNKASYLVIDGFGGTRGDRGTASRKRRIRKAMARYRPGRTLWVLSGGRSAPGGITFAQEMREYLLDCNVPKESIVVAERAANLKDLLKSLAGWAARNQEHGVWMILTDRSEIWSTVEEVERVQLPGYVVGTRGNRPGWAQRMTRECILFFLRCRIGLALAGAVWFLFFVASLMPIWR